MLHRFGEAVSSAQFADPSADVLTGMLAAPDGQQGAGSALTIVSPSADDQAIVLVSDLPDRLLPLTVTITNGKGRELELGSIRRLDSAGGATFARIVPGGLDGFVDVVIRGRARPGRASGRSRGADGRGDARRPSRPGPVSCEAMRVGLAIPQYGFSLPSGDISFVDTATWAHRAESLGFDGVWLSDHFLYSFARYGADRWPDPRARAD